MVAPADQAVVKVPPPRSRRARWLAAGIVAALAGQQSGNDQGWYRAAWVALTMDRRRRRKISG